MFNLLSQHCCWAKLKTSAGLSGC
uniref:Uncharacterized protein n=1 Tax=Anguilla anguilla TaxID=7936 RepID=A0A0E9TLP1_ANGAN